MKIAYLSDLHLEFEAATSPGAITPFHIGKALAPAKDADLIVLAGDIDVGERGVVRADTIARMAGVPVVYVAGNHEAYGSDLIVLEQRMRQAAWQTDGRVLFLNCNSARFWFGGEPLVVLGATFWTDYSLGAETVANRGANTVEPALCDQEQILLDSAPFKPADARDLHNKHRQWLDTQLTKLALDATPPKLLVVTHHAPIPEALGTRGAERPAAYASNLRAEIAAWPPLIWIHGHTHYRHTTAVASSLVVSAPRGYPIPGAADTNYACGILDL